MDEKDQIKERVDIAALIGEYLTLKPSGLHSFKALCPIHQEKSPSFHVSGDKQIWHCFGCGEGGDCFDFVMRMEGMDFPEALRHLGKRVGIEVKTRAATTETRDRDRLLSANTLAEKYYRKVLLESPQAEKVRSYLEGRGIPQELAERFGIGFAPEGWDALALFLAKRGFSEAEGERAGLLMRRRSGSGMIDRFRGRVMIPLCDRHGNTVGFTGRVLPGNDDGPKYMNSPETPVYHKGRLLYGLDLAKQPAKRAGAIIIVEGNLDVIASHKAGVEHVVASSGTALTEDQLALLKRYTGTLVFSFDQDAAGFEAARKGIALARGMGFDVRAAILPSGSGKDPDEAVQKDPDAWRTAVAHPVPIMQFLIDQAVAGRDLSQVDDKRAVAGLLLPELAKIPDAVEREHWLQTVADLLRTDLDVLRHSLSTPRPLQTPKTAHVPQPLQTPLKKATKEAQAARLLVGVLVHTPGLFASLKDLPEDSLPSEELGILYKTLAAGYAQGDFDPREPKSFYHRCRIRLGSHAGNESLLPLYDAVSLEGESWMAEFPAQALPRQLEALTHVLSEAGMVRRRRSLETRIRQAEASGDRSTVERLIHEYKELH